MKLIKQHLKVGAFLNQKSARKCQNVPHLHK